MTDIPSPSERRFHTSIHAHGSNHNSSGHDTDSGADDDRHDQQQQQQQQQHGQAASLEKPPQPPANDVPMMAVQVVDRLRWWRTRRVREMPLPAHHYIFRSNYTNYSSFGTRPLAPHLSKALQSARHVRAQYQRQQHLLQRQQLLQRGGSACPTSLTSSCFEEGPLRRQPESPQLPPATCHDETQLTRELSDLLDNKRPSSAAATPPAAAAAPSNSLLSSPTPAAESAPLTAAATTSAAAAATVVPPLCAVTIGSSLCSTSLTSTSFPSEQEAREAERLLRLYQPRAASAPVRSRRQRRVSAGCGVLPSNRGSCAAESHASSSMHLTRVPTSDDMTEVCRAAGAADSAVVLHHAPRLVIYEKDLNPRAALRTARVSSDALEGLRDAAAENSAELFALTNLPLSGFERFFYQQQLRDGQRDDDDDAKVGAEMHGQEAAGPLDGAHRVNFAFPTTPPATEEALPASDAVSSMPPGYGVVNREDALYFGSPIKVSSPTFSQPAQSPTLTSPATTPSGAADRLRRIAHRSRRATRRPQQWASLRAVSAPCLPRVYKSGCPELLPPSSPTADVAAVSASSVEGGRKGKKGPRGGAPTRTFLLPAALRSGDRPQDGAHLCHRVDDLQDVYAFNPIFDAIGKGAFSKVYAAVPILRGRKGMRRFGAVEESDDYGASASTSLTANTQGKAEVGAAPLQPTTAAPSAAASAAPANAPPRLSARTVPVVALKVIPRKARQKEQRPSAEAATSSTLAQPPGTSGNMNGDRNNNNNNNDGNNSVRRELVEIEREVSILRRLHHSGCSHFYEALRSPDAFVIAMRVYPGSMDARHYLSRYGSPSEARTALVLFQLVSTVHYLHTNFGLIHRDIKLENLLFSEVDASVSNARIGEVLGTTVHKANPLASEEADPFLEGRPSPSSTVGHNGSGPEASRTAHEVLRLLRVTLIDFGLARRTRTAVAAAALSSSSMNASRARCGGGGNGSLARPHSLNASINSPSVLASGFAGGGGAQGGLMSASSALGGHTVGTIQSPSLLSATTSAGPVSPGSPLVYPPPPPAAVSAQQQQHAQAPTPTLSGAAAAAGTSTTTFTTTRSANNSYTNRPGAPAPPPPRPPRLCRSPSTAAGHSFGMARGASRLGMPSPLPSTANMFTRFLDLDDDLDDDDSIAHNASTTAYVGAARAFSEAASAAGDASLTSPQTATASLHRRSSFAAEESAASSTDVSASETDSDVDTGDVESARSETATAAEASDVDSVTPAVRIAAADVAPASVQMSSSAHAATAPPLPSPHTPMRLSTDTSSPSASAAATNASAAHTPPSHFHRLPPSQFYAQRDDAEATLLLTPCGTEKYLPPEVLSWILERGWTRRSTTVGLARAMDMYAIGIVTYVLLSGCFPFNASSRATLLQQQQRVPRCNSARWSGVSSEAITFVQRLLEPNPLKRMTAREALEHPFLQEARQLAEKLSLVPHGEGEEAIIMSNSDHNNNSDHADGDGQFASRFAGLGSATTLNNSLRAHWSAAGRAGTSASHNSVSGTYNRASGLASPVKGSGQGGFSIPPRPTVSKHATPNTSFIVATTAASETSHATPATTGAPAAAAAAPSQEQTASSSAGRGRAFTGGAARNTTSQSSSSDRAAPPDMFEAMTREVVGVVSPSLEVPQQKEWTASSAQMSPSPPHSPAPLAPTLCAAPPAALSAAQTAVASKAGSASKTPPNKPAATLSVKTNGGAVSTAPTTPPSTQPAATKSGGDDLFESLYNNIMFSD